MSAELITDEVLKRIASEQYDVIVLNFANMDMVGHTGVLEAAIKACETVDRCVERIAKAVLGFNGVLLITADHGNAETMRESDGKVHTAHTTHPVPLIMAGENHRHLQLRQGILGDVAPTILDLLGLTQPTQMTGKTLIRRRNQEG